MTCLGGDSEEVTETSQPTSEEAELFPDNTSETYMSDNISSVETEVNVETVLTEDEEEDPAEYCPGGFHPVALGDFWNKRYCNFNAYHVFPIASHVCGLMAGLLTCSF